MMRIAHEAPKCIFKKVRSVTDYDYALLHLLFEDPEYLEMFQESSHMQREIILDNSLFELGDAMAPEKLAQGIELIKPNWYIVPDALNNGPLTCQRWDEWESTFGKEYKDVLGMGSIGVVQGSTWEEYKMCYKYISEKADKIALSGMLTPHFTGYTSLNPRTREDTAFEDKWIGRTHMIRELMRDGIWRWDKPHHLLGATNPIEFSDPLYTKFCFDSVDTSSPVMAGIRGEKYTVKGLSKKPEGKLCDNINISLTKKQEALVFDNIAAFRKIVQHV